MNQILADIVDKKEERLNCLGFTDGEAIPKQRKHPVVLPELDKNILICEIKRSSPSQGQMNRISDPVKLATEYVNNGATAISVLTESNFFNGSLRDLMRVKSHIPHIPILRKDFLLYPEDIDISFRAGADMVLLIASLFRGMPGGKSRLQSLYNKIQSTGMLPLVEIHDEEDYDFVKGLNPDLIGINSRNLETFEINPSKPHALRHRIKNGTIIYESGINGFSDAFFAGLSDFSGILVGSSIVKSSEPGQTIGQIQQGFDAGRRQTNHFYRQLFHTVYFEKSPVIKVCGITNKDDLLSLMDVGCDIAGFILANSPRQIDLLQLEKLSHTITGKMLRVGVVTPDSINIGMKAIKSGLVDALQVHGLKPLSADKTDVPIDACWYQANNISNKDDIKDPLTPFVLYDAFEKGKYGGTGKMLSHELVTHIKDRSEIFGLAGGITPENVKDILEAFNPPVIDVCSGLEKSPGKKDVGKIKSFFNQIKDIRGG